MTTCEIDGFHEDERGREHYWHCEDEAVGVIQDVHGNRLSVCERHAELADEFGSGYSRPRQDRS